MKSSIQFSQLSHFWFKWLLKFSLSSDSSSCNEWSCVTAMISYACFCFALILHSFFTPAKFARLHLRTAFIKLSFFLPGCRMNAVRFPCFSVVLFMSACWKILCWYQKGRTVTFRTYLWSTKRINSNLKTTVPKVRFAQTVRLAFICDLTYWYCELK